MPSRDVDDDPVGLQPTAIVDLALDSHQRIDVQLWHIGTRTSDFNCCSSQSEIGVSVARGCESLDRDSARLFLEWPGIVESRGLEGSCLGIPSPADAQSLAIVVGFRTSLRAVTDRREGCAGIADIGCALSQIPNDCRHNGAFARSSLIEASRRDDAVGSAQSADREK